MSLAEGFVLTFVAGTMMGVNLLPIKWMRIWKWENFWLVYSSVALVVVPVVLSALLLPNLWSVYASLSARSAIEPFLYGLVWGIAQLGAGIGVHRIGLGLTASILNGVCAASGTLIPISFQHPEMLARFGGRMILGGTLVMAVGLAFCGWAGRQREKAKGELKSLGSGYVSILILVVASGFMASLLNVALAFGGEIIQKARQAGAAPAWAPFAVWPIVLAGGFLTNAGYCFYLMFRNKTWGNFAGWSREAVNPILAGSMWMGGIAIYSSATTFLGVLGVSIGWAAFQILMILSGNAAGLFTGEWRQVESRVYKVNIAGMAVLFLAVIMIGAANYSAQ